MSSNPYEGNQGFCVSKNFGEANNITDIADLGRPDVAKKMDSDGNGKGEMWIGAPGWASANVNQVKVRDYGLLDFIEPDPGRGKRQDCPGEGLDRQGRRLCLLLLQAARHLVTCST